ncbi:hypothetical protein AHiyo4_47620 [Arthrobacter sp. Hiyo4]|nr:hypothetical protein AHiyo4_47620 [Arthrobacter sp. Hiyo4]
MGTSRASNVFTSAALLKDVTINRSAATKALTLFTTLLLAGVLTSALTGCDAAAQAATQAANKVAEAVREAPPSGNSGESSVSPADVAAASPSWRLSR